MTPRAERGRRFWDRRVGAQWTTWFFGGIPILFFTLALSAQNNAVQVREDKLTLPTYDEGAPDPNPQFDAFHREAFPNYPYTIRTPVNKIRRMADWRV